MNEPSRSAPAVIPPPEIRDGMTVYTCPRCGFEFNRRDVLARHLKTGWKCYLNYKRGMGFQPVTPAKPSVTPPPPPRDTEIETQSPVTPPKPVVTSPSVPEPDSEPEPEPALVKTPEPIRVSAGDKCQKCGRARSNEYPRIRTYFDYHPFEEPGAIS